MAHIWIHVQSWPYMTNKIFFKNRVKLSSKVECTNKQAVPVQSPRQIALKLCQTCVFFGVIAVRCERDA